MLAHHLDVAGVTVSATTRYVAFLRGMNVGGHRVSMATLQSLFEGDGFTNVETFIASGNIIFNAGGRTAPAALERRLETMLHAALGYAVATFLRTPAQLSAIAAHAPFSATDASTAGHTIHVGFLRDAPPAAVADDMRARATAMDAFAMRERELYWLCRGRTTDSLVSWPKVEKALKLDLTMRNMTTVSKLSAKVSSQA